MQSVKSAVVTALKAATALSTLQGERIYFARPPQFNDLPVCSYFEVINNGVLYADNQEIMSEICYQIDLWGRGSLSAYAIAVDTALTSIDFYRVYAMDMYEPDTRIYHKIMRYRIQISDPTF